MGCNKKRNVLYGWNTIEWDGNDGSLTPVPVPNNIPITISITYQNGLTNLPLFDVETNNNGFQISLVAPTGANPEIFYNDVLINGSAIQTCPPSTSLSASRLEAKPTSLKYLFILIGYSIALI